MFNDSQEKLLKSLDAARESYYRSETFGGRSLHFHLRSLAAANARDLEGFANDVYAVLPSVSPKTPVAASSGSDVELRRAV